MGKFRLVKLVHLSAQAWIVTLLATVYWQKHGDPNLHNMDTPALYERYVEIPGFQLQAANVLSLRAGVVGGWREGGWGRQRFP